MFERLGAWFNTFFGGYVANVVASTAGALSVIALILLTAYIAIYGFAVMRGEVVEPMQTFAWKMVKQVAIITFATGAGVYMAQIYPLGAALQDGLATIFVNAGGGYSGSAPGTAMGTIDTVFDRSTQLATILWRDVSVWRLDVVLALVLFIAGTLVFMVVAAYVVLLSKLVMTFVLAIGPIAILCLMFKQTARFFDSWLSLLLSAAVLSWVVFFALGLSFYVTDQILVGIQASNAFVPGAGPDAVQALQASCTYLVVFVLLSVMLYQAPSLASGLTGGSTVQMGAQMVANAMTSFSTLSSAIRGAGGRGSSAGGGGSAMKGGGAGYAAGRMIGSMASSAGRFAYQRAASRGGSQ